MRREAAARQAVEDAHLDVIRACGELREAEIFISAVKADERAAVGGAAARAASSADVANTHQSNIREQVQPNKVIHADYAPEQYAESQLLEAASALQKAALVLGSPLIRHWFDERRLARAQGDLMQIQVQMLAKLQRLNARTINDLSASQGDDHGRVAVGDVEDELVNVRAAHRECFVEALAAAGVEAEGDFAREAPLGVVGDCVDGDGGGPGVA
nr:MAG TPA: hypothetical protein [Caudoviricetes sp.]